MDGRATIVNPQAVAVFAKGRGKLRILRVLVVSTLAGARGWGYTASRYGKETSGTHHS
jgi:hypothetical protein